MAVLIDKYTRLLVQGLTGREGTFHAKQAAAYGTNVVGGVTPGKGGTTHEGWPVFNTVAEAVEKTGANASVIFVPPPGAADAVMEAADAGLAARRLHHRGHPDDRHDEGVRLPARASRRALIGPNCPGLISAEIGKAGIIPGHICKRGPRRHRVEERHADLRGHPPAHAARPRPDDVHRHRRRPADRHVVHRRADALRGRRRDRGGRDDRRDRRQRRGGRRRWIKAYFKKPVVGFIAGQTAPPGRRMGHAGAIIAGGKGTAAEKMAALDRGRRPRREEPGRHRRHDQDRLGRDRSARAPASRTRMGDHPGRPEARSGASVGKLYDRGVTSSGSAGPGAVH